MENRLKKVIFKKLYEDLSGVEIIPHDNTVWFIDRDNKYWYFEYKKSGELYWRHPFFINFFKLFSIEKNEFGSIISDWVEEVLNCKVVTTASHSARLIFEVEEVLNCKVVTTSPMPAHVFLGVEEVLNCKVSAISSYLSGRPSLWVKEVLNHKAVTTVHGNGFQHYHVEEVLN